MSPTGRNRMVEQYNYRVMINAISAELLRTAERHANQVPNADCENANIK